MDSEVGRGEAQGKESLEREIVVEEEVDRGSGLDKPIERQAQVSRSFSALSPSTVILSVSLTRNQAS